MGKISCWRSANGVCVEEKKCSFNSCRVDCISSPDGFCCIEHSSTNRLLQVIGVQPGPLTLDYDVCASDGAYNSQAACQATLDNRLAIIHFTYSFTNTNGNPKIASGSVQGVCADIPTMQSFPQPSGATCFQGNAYFVVLSVSGKTNYADCTTNLDIQARIISYYRTGCDVSP